MIWAEHIKYAKKLMRSRRAYNLLLVFATLLLLAVTILSSTIASNLYSANSDALATTYLFKGSPLHHQIVLSDRHSKILKFPLFYIQGHLPYNYASFTLVNVGLDLITIIAWGFLLIKLFGKKYEIPIILLLSLLVTSSSVFILQITSSTIRNIEFPIALWFIFIISDLLRGIKFTRIKLGAAVLCCILYTLVLAGDNYFEYVVSAPLIVAIAWYWVQSRKLSAQMTKALGLIVGLVIAASCVKTFLNFVGVFVIDKSTSYVTTFVPFDSLGPSIATASKQLFQIHGAFIFGEPASVHSLPLFINLAILTVSIVGLILIIKKANRSYRKAESLTASNRFIYTTLAICFFTVLFVYILSGQVVQTLSNGRTVDQGLIRYLTFLPLISIFGFVWILKEYYSKHSQLMNLIIVVLIGGIAISFPSVYTNYRTATRPVEASQTNLGKITSILKEDKVHEALTGFWYGSALRFESQDAIVDIPITGCNRPHVVDIRKDWYKPQNNIKTALIVDHLGPDAGFWSCSDEQLIEIYGHPAKKQQAVGAFTNTPIEIWTYNYDVRQKLLPLPDTN